VTTREVTFIPHLSNSVVVVLEVVLVDLTHIAIPHDTVALVEMDTRGERGGYTVVVVR